jgi:hypothetical protein
MLHIKTEDFYEDIKNDIDKWFDTTNFSNDNKFAFKSINKMKLGCFKIETGENIVTMFIGLRAKIYCYTSRQNRAEEKRKRSTRTYNK